MRVHVEVDVERLLRRVRDLWRAIDLEGSHTVAIDEIRKAFIAELDTFIAREEADEFDVLKKDIEKVASSRARGRDCRTSPRSQYWQRRECGKSADAAVGTQPIW